MEGSRRSDKRGAVKASRRELARRSCQAKVSTKKHGTTTNNIISNSLEVQYNQVMRTKPHRNQHPTIPLMLIPY